MTNLRMTTSGTLLTLAGVLFISLFSSAQAAWVTPTSNNVPANWTNPDLAQDTNTTTYATFTPPGTGWGSRLELYLPGTIRSDHVRVSSDFVPTDVSAVRIEVRLQPSGIWTNIYQDVMPNQAWYPVLFSATNIDAIGFSYNFLVTGIGYWFYEVQAYELGNPINLPVCETHPATLVEETSGILHGSLADDGGQLCQWRFQYGLTTAYSTSTEWTGDENGGTEFTALLSGLSSNATYNYRAQVKNSAGISSGPNRTFTCNRPGSGWVPPVGFIDPSNAWTNELNACDDNVNSVAKCYHPLYAAQWSPALTLTHSPIECERVRFNARDTAETDLANVEVNLNGIWTTVYSNSYPDKTWVEASFPPGTVSQARVSLHLTGTGYGLDYELNEFQFYRVANVNLSGRYDAIHPVTLVVDGTPRGTFTNYTTNVFSFVTSVGAGSRILLFYNDDDIATNSAALVTLATGNAMTNLDLYTNTLVLRSDYGGILNNTDLITSYTNDSDLCFSFNGNNINVATGITVRIPAGNTYSPGTNTFSIWTNLVVDGAIDNSAGTFIFAGKTTISGSAVPSFNNVTVTGSLVAPSNIMQVSGLFLNNGTFSNNNGTVEFNGSASSVSGTSTSLFKNVTITDTFTAPSGSTFGVSGNWVNNGTFIHNNGSVLFNGRGSIAGSTETTFSNIVFASASVVTGSTSTIYIEGNWDNSAGGSFSNNNGTIEFTGTSTGRLYGATTFFNLSCTVPGKTLIFPSATTNTVRGTLTLSGSSTMPVTLRSSTTGIKWFISLPLAAQNVTYVDVMDSTALINSITVAAGTDSTNNTNWIFAQSRYWIGCAGSEILVRK